MNPYLGLLVSRAYDGALAPEHLKDLRESAISDVTIAAQYIRSVPPATLPRLLGFDLPAVRSALLFPFRAPAGGFMGRSCPIVSIQASPPFDGRRAVEKTWRAVEPFVPTEETLVRQ